MNLGDQRKGIGISFFNSDSVDPPRSGVGGMYLSSLSLSLHALMKSKGNCKSAVLPFYNGKQIL